MQDGAKVVQEGDGHPDIGPFVFDDLGAAPPQMDRNGRLFWYGHWNDTTPGATPEGLFLDRQLVVRAGWSTVGGVAIRRLFSEVGDFHVGESGKNIAFRAELVDGTVGAFTLELGSVTAYCLGKFNSQGCRARLTWSGAWASASGASPFVVRAEPLLNQVTGLFLYGTAGAAQTPFAGGTLCVEPPLVRLSIQSSGGAGPSASNCGGALTTDLGAWIQSGVDPELVPGVRVWTQAWYRDPGFNAPDNVGLSDALRFVIQP